MVPVPENFGPGKIWSRKKITRTGKNWSRIKVPVSVPEKIGSKIKYPKKLVPVKSTGTGNGKIWGTVTLYNFYLATPERGKRKRKRKEERGKSVTFNEGEIFIFFTDLFWRNSLLEVVVG